MQFSVTADTLKALTLIAAKDDRRYYLNGVCIDVAVTGATEAVAVATDGHMLIAVPLQLDADVTAAAGQYIIPRELIDGLKARKGAFATVKLDARSVTINAGGANITAPLIDGQYPDWRRVVPRTVTGLASQIDADYLHAMKKAHKLLGGSYSPTVAHNGAETGDGGAARVLLAADAIGVIMPLRADKPVLDTPAWLERPAAKLSAVA
jgi:DNA polymerase-3 subunit beta